MPTKVERTEQARINKAKFYELIAPMSAAKFHRLKFKPFVKVGYQPFMSYLNNEKDWNATDVMILCRALNVSVETLFKLHTND